MKAIFITCVLLGLASSCFAAEVEQPSEARFLFNQTGSASTLQLLGGAILISVIAFLAFSNFSASSSSYGYNRNDYDNYDPYGAAYGEYR